MRDLSPIELAPNIVQRAYRGGAALAEFRGGCIAEGATGPEDWIGSTVHVWGQPRLGISVLPDGRPLPDAIAADPPAFLGPRRTETGLLLKLLDAGERLMVHCHPDRAFAGRYLGLHHGKTEAWIITATRGARPRVWLGFREEVSRRQLDAWVDAQDRRALLAALNEVPVRAGDVLFVPAGVPHAIGEGLLVVELQEPSDLSVMLEWEGYGIDGRRDGHMDLGLEVALEAVDRSAWSPARLRALATPVEGLLPEAASPFFRAELLGGGAELEPDFSLLVVTAGEGTLEAERGAAVALRRGSTVLVPYSAGRARLAGRLAVYRARGPAG